jgi:hypothetical protein
LPSAGLRSEPSANKLRRQPEIGATSLSPRSFEGFDETQAPSPPRVSNSKKDSHLTNPKNLNSRALIATLAEHTQVFRIGTAAEGFRMNVIDFEREGGSAVLARATGSSEDVAASLRG